MRFLFPSSLPNFKLNFKQLERPLVIPFDIPNKKKKNLINLILYGFRESDPILIELPWDEIDKCLKEQHRPKMIGGLKLSSNTILITYIDNEQQLNNYLKNHQRLRVLLTIAIATSPQFKAYRKWLSQLKAMVVESVQKTIYVDKLIDPTLFEDFPFKKISEKFEDPIDYIYFLNTAIEKRMSDDNVSMIITSTFCEMMADQLKVLDWDELTIIFSLAVTKFIDEIVNLTGFDKEKIFLIAQKLSSEGFIHLYRESLYPTAPVKKLSDPVIFEYTGQLLRESNQDAFTSIEELYLKILNNLRPHKEDIPYMEVKVSSNFTHEILHLDISCLIDLINDELITSGLKDDIILKENNVQYIINRTTSILWKETDEQKRKSLLTARSLAYLIENNPLKSLKDISGFKSDTGYGDIIRKLYIENSKILTNQGKLDFAEDIIKQALIISDENDKIHGELLDVVGVILINKGNYDQALKKLQEALTIQKELNDHSGIAITLGSIGFIFGEMGEYDHALELYEQALEIQTELGNQSGIADVFSNISDIHNKKGEYYLALVKYEQVLEILTEAGDRSRIADVFSNIGDIHSNKGEYNLALVKYEQALEILIELGDRNRIGDVLYKIGFLHLNKDEYVQALGKYEQALEILSELGNPDRVADIFYHIGMVHDKKGEYNLALIKYEQALEISTGLEDRNRIAEIFINTGVIHDKKGEHIQALEKYGQALEKYEQTLKILTEAGNRRGIADVYFNMCYPYFNIGEYNQVLEKYEQVLKIRVELGDYRGIIPINAFIESILDHIDLSAYPIKTAIYNTLKKARIICIDVSDYNNIAQINRLMRKIELAGSVGY